MKTDYLKTIIKILERSEIDSIQLSSFWGMNKIKLFKTPIKSNFIEPPNIVPPTNYVNSNPSDDKILDSVKNEIDQSTDLPNNDSSSVDEKDDSSNLHSIKAPLVGTFYLSPKPGEPPFINIGDKIQTGQILCIIEAMKIFNEIESEVSGTIKKILIDDSSPVEYGQAIILVKIDD